MFRPLLRLAFFLLCILGTGCSTFRAAERGMSRMLFSAEKESALGLEYSKQISEEYQFIEDAEATAWINEIGSRLAEHSPPTEQKFQFRLTTSEEVNAFAIPGGFCYVNVGLIRYADNEAQLAAVVGHEINHVTARHGLLGLQRQVGVQLIAGAAAVTIEDDRAAQAAVLATESGGFLATRKFGRDDEREADQLGVEAMYQAGYDPREGARFFEKLNELHGGGTPGLMATLVSTHPPSLDRVKRINRQIEAYDLWSVPLIVDTPKFQEVKKRLNTQFPPPPAATE